MGRDRNPWSVEKKIIYETLDGGTKLLSIHAVSVSPCYVLVPVLSQAPSPATLTAVILVTLVL